MRDLKSNIFTALCIAPSVHSATKSDGAVVDLQGCGSAAVVVTTGAIAGDGDFTASLVVGDAADLSGGAAATADELIGAFPATLAANSAVTVGYRGGKRYARVVLTKNGGTSIAASAVIVKGDLALRGGL
ncbi:MAG: hypothetical protein H3C26_16180 [Rhodocyclaceae bacterium]|nr:hypothetical protein [Rhodocyclaceae bacterium]